MRLAGLAAFMVLVTTPTGCATSPAASLANEQWSGKYRHSSGKFEMTIEDEINNLISVKIVDSTTPHPEVRSDFLAIASADRAKMKLLHPDPNCQVELDRVPDGINLSNLCGADSDDAGFYRKVR